MQNMKGHVKIMQNNKGKQIKIKAQTYSWWVQQKKNEKQPVKYDNHFLVSWFCLFFPNFKSSSCTIQTSSSNRTPEAATSNCDFNMLYPESLTLSLSATLFQSPFSVS